MSKKLDIKKIIKWYYEDELSTSEIANKLDTYAKKIERAIKKEGYVLRNKAEAQKIRIDSGKAPIPNKGQSISEDVKDKIAKGMSENWKSVSKEERKRRSDSARERLNSRKDKEDMQKKGFEAIYKAAKSGSKLENEIAEFLISEGYLVLIHQKHEIENKNMHLDILLPDDMIAIEIDGPPHYIDLYKDGTLQKTQERDKIKNGLLSSNGYDVIRLRSPKKVSRHFKNEIKLKLIETINNIKKTKNTNIYYI